MKRNYDLCSGRDRQGRLRYTRLPVGMAKTGMFVRLVGGSFLRIERVESCAGPKDRSPVYAAAELLQPVWGGIPRV